MVDIKSFNKKLAIENGHKVIDVNDFKIENDFYLDIVITTKDSFDYYIFIEVPFDKIILLNDKIQIKIYTLIKSYIEKIETDFHVSRYFDNNSNLIITTKLPMCENSSVFFKNISAVEEDSYYYKKQVLYYTERDVNIINDNNLIDINATEYCSSFVSNVVNYNSYILSKNEKYDFFVRLFEKLPFLSLSVIESKPLNLDDMIDGVLSKDESDLLDELIALDNDDSICSWIDSLGNKNV